METDDLLCSRNARPQKALARANGTARRASGWVRRTRARKDSLSSLTVELDGKKGIEIFTQALFVSRMPLIRRAVSLNRECSTIRPLGASDVSHL
jgi:hypothetical protein